MFTGEGRESGRPPKLCAGAEAGNHKANPNPSITVEEPRIIGLARVEGDDTIAASVLIKGF